MRRRQGPRAMLTQWGALSVSFSIDPDNATPAEKDRLINAGGSFQLADNYGVGLGPIFPLPRDWIVFTNYGVREIVDLREAITVHNWSGPAGFYDQALIRISDGRTFILMFDRAIFGRAYHTRIVPRLIQRRGNA